MSRLVTERHVRAARAAGRLVLPPGAIVTPAARDLARRVGVALVGDHRARSGEKETGSGQREPRARPTTCRVVALGADHGGFRLKETLKGLVAEEGWDVRDVGCHGTDPVDYPVFAARVADLVAAGEARVGIVVDGAGIGSAITANKVPGVRAALCYDLTTAANARAHNDANVLTLGGTLIGERLAAEIVRTFLRTPFGGGRHARRVALIEALERDAHRVP